MASSFYESFDNGAGALTHHWSGHVDTSVKGQITLGGYSGVMERPRHARFGSLDAKRPRHAEMHHEDVAVVQRRPKVFGAALQREDPTTGEAAREGVGQREAEVRPALLHRLDGSALEERGEPTPDGFDLGKFGQTEISRGTVLIW